MVGNVGVRIRIIDIHCDALLARGCFYETENIALRQIGDFTTTTAYARCKEFVDIVAFLPWIVFDVGDILRTMYHFEDCVERLIVGGFWMDEEFYSADTVVDIILIGGSSLVNIVE